MTTTSISPSAGAILAAASAEVAERVRRGMVGVRSRSGGGSGTIWSEDGLIVTNSHVVRGDEAEVILWDDRALHARVIARDAERDLAALKVEVGGLPALDVADSDQARTGQLVLAVGNPWGQRGAVTAGIIVGTGAAVENGVPLPEAIRADVRLAPGNSGGPLADARGRVVGINSMIAGGMAVAVPSNTAARFIAGDVPGQGFLGISAVPAPLQPAIAASLGAPAGLLLTEITDDSPAARAGLLPGDMLLGIDGSFAGPRALASGLWRMRPGRPVQLSLLRGGQRRDVEAVPVARV